MKYVASEIAKMYVAVRQDCIETCTGCRSRESRGNLAEMESNVTGFPWDGM